MTDPQYRALAYVLEGAGIVIALVFTVAELSGRPSPLPSIAMLFAILSLLAATVFDGLSRP
jgi:acid phosphatase family membrane protein YuiD